MKTFVCDVCGYIHEGDQPPFKCPICNASGKKFSLQEKTNENVNLNYADEHKIGVAKNADEEILSGLKDNFKAECTEVGMYLAMSRQASREGYPEIAETFRNIAFEEADHAAKFAELIGEILEPNTKKNLQIRATAEFQACQGKKNIADLAKKLNYDAVHDTIHEMCKDEARHGQQFSGLLKRYFEKE